MPDFDALLKNNPFAGDDGAIAPELASAFRENRLMKAEAVVDALGQVRVLIGAVPHSDPRRDADGQVAEHSVAPGPLSNPDGLVRVNFTEGRQAYAIFSSADSYAVFTKKYEISGKVRPVPVKAIDTAALALTRGQGLLVLDPGTPNQQWIGRSACVAIATGEDWIAPWGDPEITAHIMASLPGKVPGLERVSVDPAEGGSAFLTMYLVAGISKEQVAYAVETISDIISTEPYVKARLDVVELRPFWGGM